AARPGHDLRRVRLPEPAAQAGRAGRRVPAVPARQLGGLPGAGHPARPAGRPDRPADGVHRRERRAGPALPPAAARVRTVLAGLRRFAGPARHLLRGHRRRALRDRGRVPAAGAAQQRAGRRPGDLLTAVRSAVDGDRQPARRARRVHGGTARGAARGGEAGVRPPVGPGRGAGPVSKPEDRPGEGRAGGAPVRIGRGRVVAFAVIAVLVIAGGGTYVLRAARQSDAAVAAAAASESATPRLDAAAVLRVPHLVVRNTALGPSNGEIALVPLSNPGGPRALVDVRCERVYSVAAGGFCLTAHRGVVTTYQGRLLGPDLQPVRDVKIVGGPSRARVSADAT